MWRRAKRARTCGSFFFPSVCSMHDDMRHAFKVQRFKRFNAGKSFHHTQKNACTKNVEFTALLFMILSILQWKHIRKLANIPPVSCSIRTKYLKCHFNCSFDLLYKLAVVCLSCYPITIYYLPINNCAVLPFLYYIRKKGRNSKPSSTKKRTTLN